MIYEAQSRETITDALKIGCVIAGMGQSSTREHLLLSATNRDSWTNFVREVESNEHVKKTISAPTPMEINSFQGNCHSAENTDTLRKSVGIRAVEGQRSLNVRSAGKDIMDSVGREATRHPTKIHRKKEDGKVTEQEMAREPRRVASSKVEKAGTMGKEKVSTKSKNLQKNSAQADLGNSGLINPGRPTLTVRTGEKMTGTQQSRVLKHQQPLRNLNLLLLVKCDFRILVLPNTLNLSSLIDWTLCSEPSHLVLILLHAKLLFLPITLLHVDI